MGQYKGARPARVQPAVKRIDNEWRRWIAENVILDVSPEAIANTLVREGFDPTTAANEVNLAEHHPYVAAARSATSGAIGRMDRRIRKQGWVLEVYRRSARQATTFGQVSRVRRPSRQQFLDRYYALNQPVVIEGALDAWPALTRWTPDYLKQRVGERIVEVQANRGSDPNYEINSSHLKKEMRFADYVDVVESAGTTNDFYMTANNADRNGEALGALWEDVPLITEYLADRGPGNRGFFWYGPKGTVTPLHHDLTNNFMAQVRGSKLVRLIAPSELADVYNYRHCFSRVDLDRIDLTQYPQFRNVRIIDVTINPGDLLFLPVGWWHYVRGLAISITMTFTNFAFDNDFHSFYTTYDDIY